MYTIQYLTEQYCHENLLDIRAQKQVAKLAAKQ